MGMFSSMAIAGSMRRLLGFLAQLDKDKIPPEEQLKLLRKRLEETVEAADLGWD